MIRRSSAVLLPRLFWFLLCWLLLVGGAPSSAPSSWRGCLFVVLPMASRSAKSTILSGVSLMNVSILLAFCRLFRSFSTPESESESESSRISSIVRLFFCR
uniref:Putative secreted protein n=1 Tax=Anopheles darlingi TaxID=43151 RepID=A0A2M4D6A6_ANODA